MSSPAVNLVNLERAVKAYGQRPLLDGVSAGVAVGDRIGIVGRNGAGKSTLLAVLAGTEALDSGRATRTRGLRTGMLAQRTELTGTVASNVVGDLPEHAWAANPRTRSVLAALLPGIDLAGPAGRLSGGESRRVALAAGREHGALGAIVSGSGPTCAYLARDGAHARDLAVALTSADVCRSVISVTGPAPGATVLSPAADQRW